MFGFTFLENFNFPYIARSIREFWTRWHISLSTWFRDYVYIPLGGNRGSSSRTYFNLLVVFFLTGLWHGASWNFVVWGMYHGAFMVIERLGLGKLIERLPRPVAMLYSLPVVIIGWTFFQIDDITHAWHVVLTMLGLGPAPDPVFEIGPVLSMDVWVALIAGAVIATPLPTMALGHVRRAWGTAATDLGRSTWVLADGAGHIGLLLLCMMHMAANTYTPFLYFRF
jgi:alginate O-acetyltransferase complex protein AlgI